MEKNIGEKGGDKIEIENQNKAPAQRASKDLSALIKEAKDEPDPKKHESKEQMIVGEIKRRLSYPGPGPNEKDKEQLHGPNIDKVLDSRRSCADLGKDTHSQITWTYDW